MNNRLIPILLAATFIMGCSLASLPSTLATDGSPVIRPGSSATSTIRPTSTSRLHIPVMQDTSTPTDTPTLTPTPTSEYPPTPTQISLKGVGNGDIDIPELIDNRGLGWKRSLYLQISHTGSGSFKLVDADLSRVYFETVGDYSGTRPINWDPKAARFNRLNVVTEGAWTISVHTMDDAPEYKGDPFYGSGDMVLLNMNRINLIDWNKPAATYSIDCSLCTNHLNIYIYIRNLMQLNKSIDTSTPFIGTFSFNLPAIPQFISIQTQGNWVFNQTFPPKDYYDDLPAE